MNGILTLVWVIAFAVIWGVTYVALRNQEDETGWFRSLCWAILIPTLGLIFFRWYTDIRTEELWFESVGFANVFSAQYQAKVTLFAIGFIVAALIGWLTRVFFRQTSNHEEHAVTVWVGRFSVIIFALISGMALGKLWEEYLMFTHSVPFNHFDPQFGRDVSIYIFKYPWLNGIQQWVTGVICGLFSISIVMFVLNNLDSFGVGEPTYHHRQQRRPIGFNVGWTLFFFTVQVLALIAMFAWNYKLSELGLVIDGTSQAGISGAGWTDVNTNIPVADIMFGFFGLLVVAGLVISLVLVGIYHFTDESERADWSTTTFSILVLVVGVIAIFSSCTVSEVIPSYQQQFTVRPSESEKERVFIQHQIQETLYGYDLQDYQTFEFPYVESLTPEEYVLNDDTLSQVRIQDWQVLSRDIQAYETARAYYHFPDIDFLYDEDFGLVMASARELNTSGIGNRSWVNQHLTYTHGAGFIMVQTNAYDDDRPLFLAQGFPTRGAYLDDNFAPESVANINQRIYFGESMPWAIVGTSQPEISSLTADNQTSNYTYTGEAGVSLEGMNQLLFSLRLGDSRIYTSGLISDESRLLWRRNIREVMSEVMPFMRWDSDPYFVVGDEQLVWVLNGYTQTNNLPYSHSGTYIRRNVIATIGAYDGEINMYQVGSDPILEMWTDVYGYNLQPQEAMPAYVAEQVRYPEDLFIAQSNILARYHVDDYRLWYSNDEGWTIPSEDYGIGDTRSMDARFIWARLPGQTENQRLLIRPYNAKNRDVLMSWLVATMDPSAPVQLWEITPRDANVNGPELMQGEFDSNEILSENFTNWNQQGSRVVWGNSMVLPLLGTDGRGTVAMFKPLFIESEGNSLPKLRRVIAYANGQVLIGANLQDVLNQLYSGVARNPIDALTQDLELSGDALAQIATLYSTAESCLQSGDLVCFGTNWDRIGDILTGANSE